MFVSICPASDGSAHVFLTESKHLSLRTVAPWKRGEQYPYARKPIPLRPSKEPHRFPPNGGNDEEVAHEFEWQKGPCRWGRYRCFGTSNITARQRTRTPSWSSWGTTSVGLTSAPITHLDSSWASTFRMPFALCFRSQLSLTKIPCGLPQMPFPEAKRKALADRGPV
jgi:hypothetical protein